MTTDKQDPSRSAFEALMSNNGKYMRAVERTDDGEYRFMRTYEGWLTWQASRKQTLTEVIAIGEAELEKYAGGDHSSGIRGSYERKTLNEYIAAIMELLK